MPSEIASLFVTIGANLRGLHQGLGEAEGAISRASGALRGAGTRMSAAITAPLVGLGTAAVLTGAQFEQQMNLLGVALRGTGTDMEQVKDYALTMGADTVFSAREMADAMTGLAKAGQDWSQIAGDMSGNTGTLAAVTSLAAASDLDLAQAADAVSIAMATFGLNADDAESITDNFVRTADASVAEVGGLVDAMRNVGPVAAQFGWRLEDVNTALGILSERGIEGGDAGTALRSMMTHMMQDTDDVVGTLQELNVGLYDADGNMRTLPRIMDDLSTALGGLSEEQRNLAIQTLAGTYGMRAMGTLTEGGLPAWRAMEDGISDAASASEVADARMEGLLGMLEQIQGAVETVAIRIKDTLQPAIEEIVEKYIQPFLKWLGELNPELLKWGVILLGVAAALGPLLLALGAILPILGSLVSPVGLILVALAGLAAAFLTNFAGIRDTVLAAWVGMQPAIQGIIAWFQEKIPLALEQLRAGWETVWPALQQIFEAVIPVITDALRLLRDVIVNEVWPEIQSAIESLTGILADSGVTWSDVWQMIAATVVTAAVAITGLIVFIIGWLASFAAAAATAFSFFADAWRRTFTKIAAFTQAMAGVFQGIVEIVRAIAEGDWAQAMEMFRFVAEQAFLMFGLAAMVVSSVIETVFGTILTFVSTFVTTFIGFFQKLYDSLVGGSIIPEMLAKMVKLFTENIKVFKDLGLRMIQGLTKGILDGAEEAIEAAHRIAAKIDGAVRGALGIQSPSTVFEDIGHNITAGLVKGMIDMPALAPAVAGGGSMWRGDLNINGAGDPERTMALVIRGLQDRGMLPRTALR